MKCPDCGQEMHEGIISGDGKSGVYWKTGRTTYDVSFHYG